MPGSSIQWQVAPDILANAIEDHPDQIRTRVSSAMQRNTTRIQARMQANAPWRNRTGEARRRLTAVYSVDGDWLIITLSHGVPYGIWLELKNGGAYAIILPTLRAVAPEIMDEIRGLL